MLAQNFNMDCHVNYVCRKLEFLYRLGKILTNISKTVIHIIVLLYPLLSTVVFSVVWRSFLFPILLSYVMLTFIEYRVYIQVAVR